MPITINKTQDLETKLNNNTIPNNLKIITPKINKLNIHKLDNNRQMLFINNIPKELTITNNTIKTIKMSIKILKDKINIIKAKDLINLDNTITINNKIRLIKHKELIKIKIHVVQETTQTTKDTTVNKYKVVKPVKQVNTPKVINKVDNIIKVVIDFIKKITITKIINKEIKIILNNNKNMLMNKHQNMKRK